jgi:hypothetical protein
MGECSDCSVQHGAVQVGRQGTEKLLLVCSDCSVQHDAVQVGRWYRVAAAGVFRL